jgi:hypothetical protein
MYRLDENDRLQHDVLGQPHISPPAFCNAGGGLWSTADDYLRFVEMLMGDGTVDLGRVLSPESARLMRTDRLADEQKQHAFLGAPFWIGRGFGLNLSVVTDPTKSAPLFGPGGVGTFSWPERGDQPFAAPGWHRKGPAKTVTTIPRRAVGKLIRIPTGRSRRSMTCATFTGKGIPMSVATGIPRSSRIG